MLDREKADDGMLREARRIVRLGRQYASRSYLKGPVNGIEEDDRLLPFAGRRFDGTRKGKDDVAERSLNDDN